MGVFRADIVNDTYVRLVHQTPEYSIEFRGDPVPDWVRSAVAEGRLYTLNWSFSAAPAEEPVD